jgi:hypothetical protein
MCRPGYDKNPCAVTRWLLLVGCSFFFIFVFLGLGVAVLDFPFGCVDLVGGCPVSCSMLLVDVSDEVSSVPVRGE